MSDTPRVWYSVTAKGRTEVARRTARWIAGSLEISRVVHQSDPKIWRTSSLAADLAETLVLLLLSDRAVASKADLEAELVNAYWRMPHSLRFVYRFALDVIDATLYILMERKSAVSAKGVARVAVSVWNADTKQEWAAEYSALAFTAPNLEEKDAATFIVSVWERFLSEYKLKPSDVVTCSPIQYDLF